MSKPEVKSLQRAFEALTLCPDRTPDSELADASFCLLADCRDGGIFLVHFAGNSEWERHRAGDEVVQVVEGETTLILLLNGEEVRHALRSGELLVVPQNTWHRFESPSGVKLMTVTPQPTDHSAARPA